MLDFYVIVFSVTLCSAKHLLRRLLLLIASAILNFISPMQKKILFSYVANATSIKRTKQMLRPTIYLLLFFYVTFLYF